MPPVGVWVPATARSGREVGVDVDTDASAGATTTGMAVVEVGQGGGVDMTVWEEEVAATRELCKVL